MAHPGSLQRYRNARGVYRDSSSGEQFDLPGQSGQKRRARVLHHQGVEVRGWMPENSRVGREAKPLPERHHFKVSIVNSGPSSHFEPRAPWII